MKSSKFVNESNTKHCHSWLYDLFHTIYKNEIELECIRVSLNSYAKDLPVLFLQLDPDKRGFITSKSLWEFMRKQRLPVRSEHAYCILKLYHTEKDEKLTENDIRTMIMPTVLRFNNDYSNKIQSTDIMFLFSMLLSKEIAFIDELSIIISSLSKYGHSVYDVYSLLLSSISNKNENIITSLTLMEYFERVHAIEITADYADLIIRRLDRDKDNKISYIDFINSLYFHNVQEIEQRTSRIIRKETSLRTPSRRRVTIEENSSKKSTYKRMSVNRESANQLSYIKPLFNPIQDGVKVNKNKEIKEQLKRFIHRSKKLEKEREELAERIDFTIRKAWSIFSPEGEYKIKAIDFRNKCLELKISDANIELFLKTIQRSDYVTKSEFEEQVLPNKKAYRKLLKVREKTDQKAIPLSTKIYAHTKKLLVWVLELAFEHIKEIQELRKELRDVTKEVRLSLFLGD